MSDNNYNNTFRVPKSSDPFYRNDLAFHELVEITGGKCAPRNATIKDGGLIDYLGYESRFLKDIEQTLQINEDFKDINVKLQDVVKILSNYTITKFGIYRDPFDNEIEISYKSCYDPLTGREKLVDTHITGIGFDLAKEQEQEILDFVIEVEDWYVDKISGTCFIRDEFDEMFDDEFDELTKTDLGEIMPNHECYLGAYDSNGEPVEESLLYEGNEKGYTFDFCSGVMKTYNDNEYFEVAVIEVRHWKNGDYTNEFRYLINKKIYA